MKPELNEVISLQSTYSYAHDHGEAADFAALFTDDAVFVLPDGEEIAGRPALEEFARTSGKAGVHSSGAPHVLDDETARTPFFFVGAGASSVTAGYYHDTFSRSAAGALLFSRRFVEIP